ncbi:MAG: zf-HC2 domain-containing protein [Gammaproteobacteria bacterium]|nr:zf-HC2 domain-containing protein [Gammaproteobacteria bacterium]
MNMKCTDINIYIDEYLDRQLSSEDRISFEQHVSGCVECACRLKQARTLLTKLQDITVPEYSAHFEQRVFSEVRRQYKDEKRSHSGFNFSAGFATAAVASFAIWFVSTVYLPETQLEQPQVISLVMNQTQTVKLMFDAHKDIQQAQLSINLPGNMQLEGYPDRRTLSWKANLQKGQNILALPIIPVVQGQGELFAQITYGDTVKTFSVVLKTSSDGVQSYQLNEIKSV